MKSGRRDSHEIDYETSSNSGSETHNVKYGSSKTIEKPCYLLPISWRSHGIISFRCHRWGHHSLIRIRSCSQFLSHWRSLHPWPFVRTSDAGLTERLPNRLIASIVNQNQRILSVDQFVLALLETHVVLGEGLKRNYCMRVSSVRKNSWPTFFGLLDTFLIGSSVRMYM